MIFRTLVLSLAALGCVVAQNADPMGAAMSSGQGSWSVGEVTIEASIASVSGDTLTLQLANDSTKQLDWTQLDQAHQDRVTAWVKANAAPEGFGTPDQVIKLQTLQGQMRYDLDEMLVTPGAKVQLIFQNVDDMHHNLVICTPDSTEGMDVAKAAWELGAEGFNKGWIPDHPKVIFASRMVNPHSCLHSYFTAPKEPGDYPYVCTLPGHAAIMKGRLRVQSTAQDISELTYMLYHGDFQKLPNFDQLTPKATDHVPSGVIDLSVAKRRNKFALVFDGKLNVPEAGDYQFNLESDDGSRLEIDGNVIINHDGIHGGTSKKGKATLTEGPHSIKVSYFERDGEEKLYLGWSGPGFKEMALSASAKKRAKRQAPSIPLASQNGEAKIYRNFIEGAGNRAIGVGYDGGINLAFDADQMRLALVWIGGFIDAGRHWNGRGQGYQPPLGYHTTPGPEGAPFASLDSLLSPWPEPKPRAEGYRFKGYELKGAQRLPAFNYHYGDTIIHDELTPSGKVSEDNASLSRTLTLTGSSNDKLYFRAAAGKKIKPLATGAFLIGDAATMKLSTPGGASPILRELNGQWELLVPVTFTDGNASIGQEISFTLTNP